MKIRTLIFMTSMLSVLMAPQCGVQAGSFDTPAQHTQAGQNTAPTTTSRWMNPLSLLATVATQTYASFSYYTGRGSTVVPFDDTRDAQELIELFNANRYWLTLDPTYNVDNMIAFRSSEGTQQSAGELHIKVVRENGMLAGFIAYRVKYSTVGEVIFLAVDEKCRGKGYGEKLLAHAIKDMQEMGAQMVELVTRTNNTAAQKLYTRCSFRELSRNYHYGVVSLRYMPSAE